MFTEGKVAPIFTLVLDRGNASSTLTIGGLPSGLPRYETQDFAVAQLQIIELQAGMPLAATQLSFYTIYPEGIVFKNANTVSYSAGSWPNPFGGPPPSWNPTRERTHVVATDFPIIVDSGTTLIYLPTSLVESLLTLYDPPAFFSDKFGNDVVACDAKAPEFGVVIGGKTFYVNAADMILEPALGDGLCLTGIADGGEGPFILGDTFLTNVIAVFDVGASEMKFAAHEY